MGNVLKFIGGVVATVGAFVALPYMAVDIYDKVSKKNSATPVADSKETGDKNETVSHS